MQPYTNREYKNIVYTERAMPVCVKSMKNSNSIALGDILKGVEIYKIADEVTHENITNKKIKLVSSDGR